MKRIITSLALFAMVATGLTAQTMQNVAARRTQSLDGAWRSIIDPYGHGNWSYWQDRDFDGTRLQDYDFETSPELTVPSDWNTQRPELYYYEGNMWYRKRFSLNALNADNSRLFLHFDAANYKAKVQAASHLLDTTDMKVNQVSSKLGFDDSLYFSRLFSKIMGLSPPRLPPAAEGVRGNRHKLPVLIFSSRQDRLNPAASLVEEVIVLGGADAASPGVDALAVQDVSWGMRMQREYKLFI